ncbi:MAG: hypothetical protein ABSB57_01015, partial [Dehalococcoidia bacterium]
VMSWGAGNLGPRTVESLILEFGRSSLPASDVVQDIAQALFGFLSPLYTAQFGSFPPDNQPVMGFFLGGYSANALLAEEWQFVVPADAAVQQVRPAERFGASWRGIDRPFSRLFFGVDPEIKRRLLAGGVPQKLVDGVFNRKMWTMPVMLDSMPIQDAINFAEYILRTTIGAAEFEPGPPSCGGPLQVALIRPDTGFQWVALPELHLRGGG